MMMVLCMWVTLCLPAKFTCFKYIHLCNYDVTTYCKYIIIFNDVTVQLEFIFVCLQNVCNFVFENYQVPCTASVGTNLNFNSWSEVN